MPSYFSPPGVQPSGSVSTDEIADDAVTYAKIQNVSATDRLLGRDTAAAGNTEELTVGGGLEFSGSAGIQRSALTGDVTAAAASGATVIANDAVNKDKLNFTLEDVTVAALATTGTATVTAGAVIIGCYPVSNQDSLVDSVAISDTTLTVTLAVAAVADNVFKVAVIEP